jgi:guanylate kinase
MSEPIFRTGNLIVLSGPSGAGKSTLVGAVRKRLPDLEFSISCTTRKPRPGELHGREYFFLTPEEFEARSQAGGFVEEARVFANRYGTLKSEVLDRVRRGADVILDIDVQGAGQIRKAAERDVELANAAVFVLIAPPSLEVLESRLRSRATDSEEQLALRLAAAERELEKFRLYDYVVVNDDLATAVNELEGLFCSFRLRTKVIAEGSVPWGKK